MQAAPEQREWPEERQRQAEALTPRWTPLRFHAGQSALWRSTEQFVNVAAGRGSGKTELAKRRLVRFLPIKKEWPDPRYFYGAPTQQQAERIAWQDMLDLTPARWVKRIRYGDRVIETVFGSSLHVIGLDNPHRIEGVQWDGCVLDESCDLKPKTFDLSLAPTFVWRKGWAWRIGVPKRQGPGAVEFHEVFKRGLSGEHPSMRSFAWPSSDLLSEEVLAFYRHELDAKDYREQFEASWETASGTVFYAFDPQSNVRPCEYFAHKPLVVGCDFNVDPMAWVIGHRYQDRLEIFDEIWLRNTNTAAALDVLASRYEHHRGGFEFYPDASGGGRHSSASMSDHLQILNHARLKAGGVALRCPRANPPIADRFAETNAMLCNADGDRRLFVAPNCKHLIQDLESRYYRPFVREPADKGDLGHVTDSLSYCVHMLFPIRLQLDVSNRVVLRK